MRVKKFKVIKPHQDKFVYSQKRFTLNSGGVGSGKTVSLVLRSIRLLTTFPGIIGLIGGITLPLIKNTTMREFQAFCPPQIIKYHNKTERRFVLKNGSEIIFTSLDDPTKYKSYTLGFVGIEEMSDIKEEMFNTLRDRLRQKGYDHSLFGATNPSNFNNFVYKNFIENPIDGSEIIYSKSSDNFTLPKDYLADLENYRKSNPEYYKRMVDGIWGAVEGQIYDLPIAQRFAHSEMPDVNYYDEIIAGLDFGYNHPTAFVVAGLKDGKIYLLDEIYGRKLNSKRIAEYIKPLVAKWGITIIYADGSRPEIIDDLCEVGLPVYPADKSAGSVFAGILYIEGLINSGDLIVSTNCHYTLREFDSYVWDKKIQDKPLKINDDAMDAVRYAIYTHKGSFKFEPIVAKNQSDSQGNLFDAFGHRSV